MSSVKSHHEGNSKICWELICLKILFTDRSQYWSDSIQYFSIFVTMEINKAQQYTPFLLNAVKTRQRKECFQS